MRTRSASTILRASAAALVGLLIAFGATTATSSAAPAAASTMAASSTSITVIAGRTATLTIRLQDPTSGAPIRNVPVKLSARADSTKPWTAVATATTNSSGDAALAVKPLHNTQYVWTFAGNSQYAPTTSAVVNVLVAPAVSITAARPSSSTLSIWGGVTPSATGQKVGLQLKVGRVWKTWAAAVVITSQRMPNGRTSVGYLFHLSGIHNGTYVTRATRPATSTNAAGGSPTLTIKLS
jgi:5-hydroxyisourate hydrolase-like protein (transthyretin family)